MFITEDPFIIIKAPRQEKEVKGCFESKRLTSWSKVEHLQYLTFFDENMESLRENCSNKAKKMFIRMAQYIPTRTASQIKSHHQKLLLKFGSVETILNKLTESLKRSTDREFNSNQALGKDILESIETNSNLVSTPNSLDERLLSKG